MGKTVLTSLLLSHLRQRQVPAFAIKPFSSGDRADAELLHDLQEGELALEEINPYFFPDPLAPWVAARRQRRSIRLEQVLRHVRSIEQRLRSGKSQNLLARSTKPVLLIEGVGGLLVPLGPRYFVLDLIRKLRCEVIVVSGNKLGTINHTLLTIHELKARCPHLRRRQTAGAFQRSGAASLRVVLREWPGKDVSAASNPDVLAELLRPVPLSELPFFPGDLRSVDAIKKIVKKIEKTLAHILG